MNVTTNGHDQGQSGTTSIASPQTPTSGISDQKCSEISPSSAHPQAPHGSHIQISTSNLKIGTVSYAVSQRANGGWPSKALSSASSAHQQDSRKPKSDAFFIDLASPVSIKPLSVAPSLSVQVKANVWEQTNIGELESAAQFRLSERMLQAAENRKLILHDRKRRLRLKSELIKRKVLLQRHRDRLDSLKCKAHVDFSQSSAAIKRHIFLQERAEFLGAMVQRAHRVAVLSRLGRSVKLRKSVSVSFAELLSDNITLDAYLEADDLDMGTINDEQQPGSPSSSIYSPQSPISPSIALKLMNRRSPTNLKPFKNALLSSPISSNNILSIADDQPRSQSLCSIQKPIPKSTSVPQLSDALGQCDISEFEIADMDTNSTVPAKVRTSEIKVPPITRQSLRELDVTEILSNAQLRHDLLFDPDMQFRPNIDGERGTQREILSDTYWSDIKIEIQQAEQGICSWIRVPALIQEIKEIVLELIPGNVEFSSTLNEIMDIELISQTLNKTRSLSNSAGTLVEFLAGHMHQYCAPCRDPLIDEMVELFKSGKLAEGLKLCVEVLELMKLDFANHHLKKLRPWIVENSVEFEWRYFKDRLEAKVVTIESTENWLHKALDENRDIPPQNVYNKALVQLIVDDEMSNGTGSNKKSLVPETMWMDTSRLSGFHNDYQDLSIMAVLLILYKQICGKPAFANLSPGEIHSGIIETKKTLWTLLNHANTTMAHVATQLTKDAGIIRGQTFSPAEIKSLHRLVDTTLTFDHPLFMLFQKRVAEALVKYLDQNGRLVINEELDRVGLLYIRDELSELGGKIMALATHNRATYRLLYDSIIEEWKRIQ